MATFNIKAEEVAKAITPKTRAIMLVHLLGNPCNMEELLSLAEAHRLLVIEDCCEAHGAEYRGRKVGSFGALSTFSFFFSHHISTIEGGMVLTSGETYYELSKCLRVFGWIRDLGRRQELAAQFRDIDERFLFVNNGYNFRPTEIQGAFGIHQLGKLESLVEIRRDNARYWTESLWEFSEFLLLHQEKPGTRHAWLGYPITVKPGAPFTRQELVQFLEAKGVETRPIQTGNMAEQPALQLFPYRKAGDLENARLIHRNSFWFGNHQGIGRREREAIVEYMAEFIARKVRR